MNEKTGASTAIPRTKKPKRNRRWSSLLGPYEAGTYLVVPLLSAADLRDEAWLMMHCVGKNYPTWCKQGVIRIFSIRDLDGNRLATASLFYDYDRNRWCLEQCKGYANTEICLLDDEPTDLHFVVQDLVRLYQRAHEAAGEESP